MFATMVMATRGSGRPATAADCTAMLTACGAPVRYGSSHAGTTGGRRRLRADDSTAHFDALPPAALALAGRQASFGSSEAGAAVFDRIFGSAGCGGTPTPRSTVDTNAPSALSVEDGAGGGGEFGVRDVGPGEETQVGWGVQESASGAAVGAAPPPLLRHASSSAASIDAAPVATSDAARRLCHTDSVGEEAPAHAVQAADCKPTSGTASWSAPSASDLDPSESNTRSCEPVLPLRSVDGTPGAVCGGPFIGEPERPLEGFSVDTGTVLTGQGSPRARSESPSSSLLHLKGVRHRQRALQALKQSRSSGGAGLDVRHVEGEHVMVRSASSPSPALMHLPVDDSDSRPGGSDDVSARSSKYFQQSGEGSDAGKCLSPGVEQLVDGGPLEAALPTSVGGLRMHADVSAEVGLCMHASPLPAPFLEQQPQATLRSPAPSAVATVTQHGSTVHSIADVDSSVCGGSEEGSVPGLPWHSPSSTGAPPVQTMACSDADDSQPACSTAASPAVSRCGDGGSADPPVAVADGTDGRRGGGSGYRNAAADLTSVSTIVAPARLQATRAALPATEHGRGLRTRPRRRSVSLQRQGMDPAPGVAEPRAGKAPPRSGSLGVSRSSSCAGVHREGSTHAAESRGASMRTVARSVASLGRESALSEAGMEPPRELAPHDELISPEESLAHSQASGFTANTACTAAVSGGTAAHSRAHTARTTVASAGLTPACSLRSEFPGGDGVAPVELGDAGGEVAAGEGGVCASGPWEVRDGVWVRAEEEDALSPERVDLEDENRGSWGASVGRTSVCCGDGAYLLPRCTHIHLPKELSVVWRVYPCRVVMKRCRAITHEL